MGKPALAGFPLEILASTAKEASLSLGLGFAEGTAGLESVARSNFACALQRASDYRFFPALAVDEGT